MARKKSIQYVNNPQFSQAVVDYVGKLEECRKDEISLPKVPDYIAQCFLRIAEGYLIKQISFDILIEKKWLWMQ